MEKPKCVLKTAKIHYCQSLWLEKLSTESLFSRKLTFSSSVVKHWSPPSLFITCATPITSPAASLIGMHRRALVLYPVCISTSSLKRSSCNQENVEQRLGLNHKLLSSMKLHSRRFSHRRWLITEHPSISFKLFVLSKLACQIYSKLLRQARIKERCLLWLIILYHRFDCDGKKF